MTFKFSTKAQNLDSLKNTLTKSRVMPLTYFTLKNWQANKSETLKKIYENVGKGPYIVRSSALSEDSETSSNAGAYLSLLNISKSSLSASINKVFDSYCQINSCDEVLVQQMLNGVTMSGVIFSHDPSNSSPYRIINWTDKNDTTIVTGGKGGHVYQYVPNNLVKPPKRFRLIIKALDEILNYLDQIPVDIEFCITRERNIETFWLLQIRPLILKNPPEPVVNHYKRIYFLYDRIKKLMEPQAFLLGDTTLFVVTPDWNPGEIIGIRPKPLAHSLYRDLITDATWAYQRFDYGYRDLRGHSLMPNFFGLPYIDVRLSFNSFIPADLDEEIAKKLANYYIEKLRALPKLHDKVEFEIVFSCLTFDVNNRLERLKSYDFNDIEISKIYTNLHILTKKIIDPEKGLWIQDVKRLKNLVKRREKIMIADLSDQDKIYWLLEDARRFGTLPFAGLARAAFIAVQFLKSILDIGIFSKSDYDNFLSSIKTVSKNLSVDKSKLSKEEFLIKYGHLRPGTYDILSPRYDEQPDKYFDWNKEDRNLGKVSKFILTNEQRKEINNHLNNLKIGINADQLFYFIRESIEYRETAKFLFTKNLSDAIRLIKDFGSKIGFSPEDLAFCNSNIFKNLSVSNVDFKAEIYNSIINGKQAHKNSSYISLPSIISSPDDVWSFEHPETEPNFISQKSVIGKVTSYLSKNDIDGSIVFIPNADPGFDWIFSFNIIGLVTAWGGVNSHMAIRAGEIGLPAVIGVGEINYKKWFSSNVISIDCSNKKVEIIS